MVSDAVRFENNAGAKDRRRQIKHFQAYLNSPRLVPEQCYRMSSASYPLVCYVNQITGLYLSKNYAVIPIFLARALDQTKQAHGERVSERYRELVIQYLSHVAHFLTDFACFQEGDEYFREFIPGELLDILPHPLPEDGIVSGEF